MGLFKKRTTEPGELGHLRSEIAAMAARLDAADSEKARLEQRVQQLDAAVQHQPQPPAPAPEPVISQGDLDMMRARIQRLYDRLDDPAMQPPDPVVVEVLEARIDRLASDLSAPTIDADEYAALRSRVDALQSRLDTPIAPPPIAPPPAPPPAPAGATVDPAELDEIRARIDALHDRVSSMDARITSISTELANQLTELSGDVDALARRAPVEPAEPAEIDSEIDRVVDEIRDAQLRLANEQARYQIAFRHELADLAERLRRT
jgi:chromosome segregation ATPase